MLIGANPPPTGRHHSNACRRIVSILAACIDKQSVDRALAHRVHVPVHLAIRRGTHCRRSIYGKRAHPAHTHTHTNTAEMWRLLLHISAFLHFLFTLYYDWFYIIPPFETQVYASAPWFRPYKFKYLTFWDVILQTVFFGICVLADLVAKDDKNHALRRLQNRVMVSLAYPLAMFVGVTFWSIYLVDRELILPKAMDAFFPVWLNHCLHTNIVVFMLIEFVTTSYSYAPRETNVKILLSVMISYLVWLFIIFSATGVWVYPILHVLSWPLKIVFFIGCLGLVLGLYLSGERLNSMLATGSASQRHAGVDACTSHDPEASSTDERSTIKKEK